VAVPLITAFGYGATVYSTGHTAHKAALENDKVTLWWALIGTVVMVGYAWSTNKSRTAASASTGSGGTDGKTT
jgi:hypothetical protein